MQSFVKNEYFEKINVRFAVFVNEMVTASMKVHSCTWLIFLLAIITHI